MSLSKEAKFRSDNLPKIEILKEPQDLLLLEEEWKVLYCHCLQATPFQSWAWLYSWWEHYGEGYELQLVTVRNDEGLLVGIFPLMLERRAGFGRLLFIGTGLSDYLDVVVRAGWEDKVFEAGVQALERIDSWHIADLQQLRSDAAAWGIFRRWDGPRIHVRQDGSPVVEVKPWDELLTSLSKNLRSTVRRAVRRAMADGLRRQVADATDTKQAAQRLVALHREAWQERDIGSEHLTQRFEDFTIAAADRIVSEGLGFISEFWQDEEVLVSDFIMLGRDFLATYTLGASRKALQRYQWSSLYIWDAVDIAHNKNRSHLDLLRGEEPYKLRWSSRIIPTHRLILGQHWMAWIPYASYHTLRSRAKLYASSESAPQWIKSVTGKYRALRHVVNRGANKIRRPF
jgi:CelD/BcsL family acetyltransferase involved in cellulose biosynthesis